MNIGCDERLKKFLAVSPRHTNQPPAKLTSQALLSLSPSRTALSVSAKRTSYHPHCYCLSLWFAESGSTARPAITTSLRKRGRSMVNMFVHDDDSDDDHDNDGEQEEDEVVRHDDNDNVHDDDSDDDDDNDGEEEEDAVMRHDDNDDSNSATASDKEQSGDEEAKASGSGAFEKQGAVGDRSAAESDSSSRSLRQRRNDGRGGISNTPSRAARVAPSCHHRRAVIVGLSSSCRHRRAVIFAPSRGVAGAIASSSSRSHRRSVIAAVIADEPPSSQTRHRLRQRTAAAVIAYTPPSSATHRDDA